VEFDFIVVYSTAGCYQIIVM